MRFVSITVETFEAFKRVAGNFDFRFDFILRLVKSVIDLCIFESDYIDS